MGSKSKWIGLIILLAVIGAAAVYLLLGGGPQPEPAVLRGYVGGEKIGLLEDEAVQDILDRNYRLTLDYAKAGSLDMVTADHEGRNFLFPSSQTALEYYQQLYGAPDRSQIVFNTPIVLYTHRPILEAFQKEGLVTERDGVYYMDMAGLVAEIEAGTAWADLGLPELYGTVAVNTTDPVRSNSGNMFAGLLANVEYVRGAAGQCAVRRGGGCGQCGGRAAPPEGHLREAGLYGGVLLRPLRPVPQDRHGGQAHDRRL